MDAGIEEFRKAFIEQADRIYRYALLDVAASIIEYSPTDEGEFVSEWTVEVDREPRDEDRPDDPQKDRAEARLAAALQDVVFGEKVTFANYDPVAVRLEFGYSDKAPLGMVRITAERWEEFVASAAGGAF